MDELRLRAMERGDWPEVADLIHLSTNYWYRASGKGDIFAGDPAACELFCRVYEALDPGCCILAVGARTGRIVGSCFYHPRSTHISVGIVNVHPAYFGKSVARRMLGEVISRAEREGKPVRLVSSAMNLDSFSLYTRVGFVPRTAYQDMRLSVPASGLSTALNPHVRPATPEDIPAMVALEREVSGIEREKDYRYFLQNEAGIWHASILPAEDGSGELEGFLVSVADPGSNLLGPGIARTDAAATDLIRAELDHHRGRSPVFLVPADRPELVAAMYALGARNCEIHFAQVRGEWQAPRGVVMPTFMPETG